MKDFAKSNYVLFAVLLSLLSYNSFAGLTVTVTGINGNCLSDAGITATVSGNTGTVNYELINVSTSQVVRNYQSSNLFNNLPAGIYKVQVQDASNAAIAQSDPVLLTTTYVTMNIIVTDGVLGCTTTTGTITVAVTGGKTPYSYVITAGPVTAVAQASDTFTTLPEGSYTLSVTDACGVSVTASASVAVGTSTTVANIVPRYHQNDPNGGGAFVEFGKSNNTCTDGAFVNIGGGWGYKGSGTVNLTTFDQHHFSWRYIYPSGSSTMYGAGGILNAAAVSCTNNFLEMPASASYPYASGDLIIYDECGNSTILKGYIQPITNISASYYGFSSRGDYDCVKGGSLDVSVSPHNLLCLPVYWTSTDQTTGTVSKDTSFVNNAGNYTSFRGFTPGHTYTIAATDAGGHNAAKNTSAVIPGIPAAIIINEVYPDYDLLRAGFPRMQFPYTFPDGTLYSYTVTASSTTSPAVGYSNSYTLSSTGGTKFSDPANPFIYGPNTDGSWPTGTFTITVSIAGCFSNAVSFTITGIDASLSGASLAPVCGGFSHLAINATLDNPSIYGVKILAGSTSNVGAIRTFGSGTTAGNYSCLPFNGLSYGTYNIGLVTTSTSIGTGGDSLVSLVFNYAASNMIVIDALATGGYICNGSSIGSLTVIASSASGSALQYSANGGINWQSSNIFTSMVPGTYPVVVKDVCGNTATYNASVVQASGISTVASANLACAGSSIQLNVNAFGATGYLWSGPNGFTSILQNPLLNNIQAGNEGTYNVTVTSATCTNTSAITITVNALPVVSAITGNANICVGSATQLTDTTAGGVWSSSDSTIATVDATGKVNGIRAGNSATISYTVTNIAGCTTTVVQPVTVNALPVVSMMTGAAGVCLSSTTQFNDATAAGVWSSSDSSIATVDATGKVSGLQAGGITISYLVTNAQGCKTTVTQPVTVNTLPAVEAITNTGGVCMGSSTQFNDATAAGIWSSSDSSIVTVDASGKVSGLLAGGTATISYTVTSTEGCITTVTQPVTVNFCGLMGLAKNLDDITLQVDGTYNAAFTFVVQNQGQTNLTNIEISDNLVNAFTTGMDLNAVSLSSTGATLLVNNKYTGTGADTALLSPGSSLIPLQTDSIHLIININSQKIYGTFYNIAYGSALSNGMIVTAGSVNGLNAVGNPSPTPIIIHLTNSILHIPGGFSPNNDGINDKFVIGNNINYNLNLEIYNRWGNKVYDSKGFYQNNWDGTCNQAGALFNTKLPDGTYYYILKVFDKLTGSLVEKPSGYLTIKR